MQKEDLSLFSSSSLFSVQFNSKLKNLKSVILIKRNTSGPMLPISVRPTSPLHGPLACYIEGKFSSHTPLYSLFLSSENLGNFKRRPKKGKTLATFLDSRPLHTVMALTFADHRMWKAGLRSVPTFAARKMQQEGLLDKVIISQGNSLHYFSSYPIRQVFQCYI